METGRSHQVLPAAEGRREGTGLAQGGNDQQPSPGRTLPFPASSSAGATGQQPKGPGGRRLPAGPGTGAAGLHWGCGGSGWRSGSRQSSGPRSGAGHWRGRPCTAGTPAGRVSRGRAWVRQWGQGSTSAAGHTQDRRGWSRMRLGLQSWARPCLPAPGWMDLTRPLSLSLLICKMGTTQYPARG